MYGEGAVGTGSAVLYPGVMVALICPSCGAPLPAAAAHEPQVTCDWCRVTVCRDAEDFLVKEGSVPQPPPQEEQDRRGAFLEAIGEGLADGEPREVLIGALVEHMGLQDGAAVVADVTLGLASTLSDEHGVDLSRDAIALCRLAEAYLRATGELRESGTASLNLPFLGASSSGPFHLDRAITIADVRSMAVAGQKGPGPKAGARKKRWWPF